MQYVIWALLVIFFSFPVIVAQIVTRKEEQDSKGGQKQ